METIIREEGYLQSKEGRLKGSVVLLYVVLCVEKELENRRRRVQLLNETGGETGPLDDER